MRIGSLFASARAQVRTAASRRRLHLTADKAEELLSSSGVYFSVSPSASNTPLGTLLIFPSRRLHRPSLSFDPSPGAAHVVEPWTEPLDINAKDVASPDLQDRLAAVLGTGPGAEVGKGKLAEMVQCMWDVYRDKDVLRISADVCVDDNGLITASSPAIQVDDFALYRHPEFSGLGEPDEHPLEAQAKQGKLFYQKTGKGNIGCYGYGAGVAMSTMDALILEGGEPTNFLDGGGGATEANVRAAIELLLADPDVKVIFVNSFGGLTKTDLIAEGIVKIMREKKGTRADSIPMIVRLRGTGEARAAEVINAADDLPNVRPIPEMGDAAKAAVKAAREIEAGR